VQEILTQKHAYGKGQTAGDVMIEFVSPNTNKALHLGHLRNAVIGDSLARIMDFAGFRVIKTCLNNDRGMGMSEAMLGYKLFHAGESPESKPDHFVSQCYVDFKQAEHEHPELKEQAQQLLVDWEQGKPACESALEKR